MLTVLLSFTFANFAKVMLYASEPDSYETNVKVGDRVINFSEGIPQYDGQKELLAIPTENKLKEAGAETNVVRKIAVIKLIYDPAVNPCPLVQVKVGDSEPLLLVVDTGSSEVDLYPWAVNKLRLAEQPGVTQSKVRINGKSGNSLIFSSPLKMTILGPHGEASGNLNLRQLILDIDNASEEYLPSFAGDGTGSNSEINTRRVAGTIGMKSFVDYPIQFDFVNKLLTVFVEPPSLPQESKNDAVRLPLRVYGSGVYQVPYRLLISDRDGISVVPIDPTKLKDSATISAVPANDAINWLIVDTGSNYTLVPKSVIRLQPSVFDHNDVVEEYAESYQAKRVLLNAIVLGDNFSEPDVEGDIIDTVDPSFSGSLGMNYLSRFRVMLDQRRHELWLARADNYAAVVTHIAGTMDIYLKPAKKGRYRVDGVKQSSFAQSAGVREQDEIAEIDGVSLHTIGPAQVYRLQRGFRDQVCCMMLRHKSKKYEQAVWYLHADPYPQTPVAAQTLANDLPVIFLLKKTNMVLVRYADNREIWVPYYSKTPPPYDALTNCHWQRVSCHGEIYAWMLLPDTAIDPTYSTDASALILQRGVTSAYAVPFKAKVERDAATGMEKVTYPDGFSYHIGRQGALEP